MRLSGLFLYSGQKGIGQICKISFGRLVQHFIFQTGKNGRK